MCWKPILLISCVLAACCVSTASAQAPVNDDCQNALTVGDVTDLAFDTTNATFDGPGHVLTSPNIWYCYTATCDGCATVSLLGSSFDTKLAVYDGCACDPALGDLIESNDDHVGLQSEVTFPVMAGNKYLIEVGGAYATAVGPGLINISCGDVPGHPTNDDCSKPAPVGNVQGLLVNTACATFDGPGHCLDTPNLWYSYTAVMTGDVTVSLSRLPDQRYVDPMLAVYDGNDCYPTLDSLIECNDDYNGYDSQITFPAIAGHRYLIEVGTRNSDESGPARLTISNGAPPTSSNDDCMDAWPIGEVKNLPFDTTSATFDTGGSCMYSPNIWYCYTAGCTGQATISLCGSEYDTMLAVYNGCTCNQATGEMLACNDDACGRQSQVTIDVTAGQTYLIEIGGYGNETGHGVLTVSVVCAAPTKPDLGDAPDSTNNFGKSMSAYPSMGPLPVTVPAHFPTVFNDGSGTGPYGPSHLNAPAVAFLGKKISRESEADKGPDEDGLNNISPQTDSSDDDLADDGVVVPLNLPYCDWTTISYDVTVVDPTVDLWVNVWLDFNRDGDWDDTTACDAGSAPEWAVQNQYLFGLPVGLSKITTPGFLSWHPKSGPEGIWMRITLSEQPWKGGSNPGEQGNGGSGPASRYLIGETEDYYFIPDKTPAPDCPLCQDVNGDGVIDMKDLTELTAQWLEQCF